MQITRVGVEQRELRLRGLDHPGVAVPDERHVVVNVEVRPAGFVVQILHPAAHDLQRMLIRDTQISSQPGLPRGKRLPERRLFRWKSIGRNSEQQIWIRREARPYRTLRSVGHTRKIGPQLKHVEDDLKMEVWRPAAILLC